MPFRRISKPYPVFGGRLFRGARESLIYVRRTSKEVVFGSGPYCDYYGWKWALAKRRGLPRNAGHKQGAKAFENICDYCQKIGVKYVTAYAFSTENWKRPQSEVDAIMELLRSYLKEASKQVKRNVRLLFLGDRKPLAFDLQQLMESAERESEKNTGSLFALP